ncbi:MAG: hypothetical protein Q9161_008157 [Pseudevernia consocians]
MSFTPIGANQTDHTRIRKLFSHAFSDSALLEQEPLLTIYFKLLISKLKEQIDGPAQGRVDMMAYYNFTTFDVIGGVTYFMLQNPAVLHRVQKEVRETFKKEDDITLRSVSTPSSLTYMEAVLQESLRCYPSIPATLPRITGPEGALIDGNYVPAKVRRNLSFRI